MKASTGVEDNLDVTEKQNAPATSTPASGSACRVWLVRELVMVNEEPKCEKEQDCFVLAVTAIEAAAIVGEENHRRIIRVADICPISKLPGDKYVVTPNAELSESAQENPKP